MMPQFTLLHCPAMLIEGIVCYYKKTSIPYALQFMYIVILLQKYMQLQWYCSYTSYISFLLVLYTTSMVQWLEH